MKYRELQTNDVVMRDGKPIFVILECNPEKNVFRWFSLLCTSMGEQGSPDLECTQMWDESVYTSYDAVLRGDETLNPLRKPQGGRSRCA